MIADRQKSSYNQNHLDLCQHHYQFRFHRSFNIAAQANTNTSHCCSSALQYVNNLDLDSLSVQENISLMEMPTTDHSIVTDSERQTEYNNEVENKNNENTTSLQQRLTWALEVRIHRPASEAAR